jgi:hypothetical protein
MSFWIPGYFDRKKLDASGKKINALFSLMALRSEASRLGNGSPLWRHSNRPVMGVLCQLR